MARGDGKDKFYRYLELDEETKKVLKFYREIHPDLVNDKYEKEGNDEEK